MALSWAFASTKAMAAPRLECASVNAESLLQAAQETSQVIDAEITRDLPVIEHKSLRWVAVSWEGPLDGKIFVVDCQGRVRAALPMGYFERVAAGPTIGGRATLEVLYVPESGANIREQSVALLTFDGNSVKTLWEHKAIDATSAPLAPKDEATTFKWKYYKSTSRIRVTGKRVVGEITDMHAGSAVGIGRTLPAESYCFHAKEARFERCQ